MASFTEYPDIDVLSKIFRHKQIYDDQRSLYEVYYRNAHSGSVKIDYQYKHFDENCKGFGRIYPTKYIMSAIYQWNAARSKLFGKTEKDIDIVNSQLSILLGYCEQLCKIKDDAGRFIMNSDHFKNLRYYVENRQQVINDIFISPHAARRYNQENNDNRTKKDLVKTLVIMLCFGSTTMNWVKTFGLRSNEFRLSQWVKDFESELIYIATTVVNHNPKKKLAVKIWRDKEIKKRSEKKGKKLTDKEIESIENNYKKILALILQDKETEICLNAIHRLEQRGFIVTAYIYDGFQILNNQELTQDDLDAIENKEFNCKFIVKPFCEPLNMADEYLLPEPPSHFRPAVINSLGYNKGLATTDEQALAMKKYFETFVCWMEGSNKISEENSGRHYYHPAASGAQRFSNCFIYKEDKDGNVKKTSWFKHWEQLEDRLSYRSKECIPPPLYCPENVYNLWNGWPIEKIPLDTSVSYEPIMKLFNSVCGHNDEVVEYLLNWFAHKVQYPGKKSMVAIVLYTQEEGTGKTSIAEGIFGKFFMDKAYDYMMSTSQMEDIVGKFSTAGEKLSATCNEINLGETSKFMNQIKGFITDPKFNKEIKGVQSETIDNVCDVIFTTNNPNAIKISQADRRFQVIEPDGSVANNIEFFTPIHIALNDDKVMRHFFEFLKNRDISKFVPTRDRVMTAVQKEFKINTLSTIQEFAIDLYRDEDFDRMKELTYKEFYEKYQIYCANNGKSDKVMPNKAFSMNIKKQVKGYSSKRVWRNGGNKNIVMIDWAIMGAWVKDNTLDDDDECSDSGMGCGSEDSEEECEDI